MIWFLNKNEKIIVTNNHFMNKDTSCELSLSDDTFVLPLLSASSPLSSLAISNLFDLRSRS